MFCITDTTKAFVPHPSVHNARRTRYPRSSKCARVVTNPGSLSRALAGIRNIHVYQLYSCARRYSLRDAPLYLRRKVIHLPYPSSFRRRPFLKALLPDGSFAEFLRSVVFRAPETKRMRKQRNAYSHFHLLFGSIDFAVFLPFRKGQ